MSPAEVRSACCLAALLTLACIDLPGTRTSYRVAALQARGPYLAARLEWTDGPLAAVSSDRVVSLLFPDGAACRELLAPGAAVEYAPSGWEAELRRDDLRCRSAGIFDLASWRDRHTRPQLDPPVPRRPARYRVVLRDSETALLRGRFPLTGLVGWAGGWDSLALVAPGGACDAVLAGEVASIEYRPHGPNALALVGDSGLCPIQGLARPADADAVADPG